MEFAVELTGAQSRVIIEKGCHTRLKDYMDFDGRVMVVTDDNIPDSLKETVLGQFDGAVLAEVPQGEKAKSLEIYSHLLAVLLENGFSRKDWIIALGGGVVGDLAGFVASTYKRGCRFVSIPTSTLAQIDSSIGGKVAINMNGIKNCVGSFYHPHTVFVDTDTLKTLEKRHFYNGLVEAVKAGCICDEQLFNLFKEHAAELDAESPYLEEIITRSLLIKRDVVQQDEKEQHLRKILNFGHTIGHAIESLYNLRDYYHGECVANGMLMIEENGQIKSDLISIFTKMHIPFITDLDAEKCIEFIKNDKKAGGGTIDIVKVDRIGEAYIEKIEIEEMRRYFGS
ncbi:MAG: 3-dehydroquinate synthase [Oscillospiraceae bacterium]|nr:3-dehydroquinate synthase [Oscillospiraceae bacterium]